MNDRLSVLADERGGWFTLGDAVLAGYSENEIQQRLRDGTWRRLCRDAYVEPAERPSDEPPWERSRRRHILLGRVIHHRLGGRAVLSHQTATVLYGLPTWGLDLRRVHVTRSTGRSRSDRLMVCHRSPIPPTDVTELHGLRLTIPARALVESACGSSYETALVLFDAAVRVGLVTPDELSGAADRFVHWSGSPAARAAVDFVDGRSESVGESRLRLLMANYGLPAPELQVELRGLDGRLLGRVDFLFVAQNVVVEFDGELKYREDQGGDAVIAEKWREDRLRERGYQVVRVSWADLDQPSRTAERIRAFLTRSVAA